MVRKESVVRHPIENMSENLLVIPDHLVKLCDDVLSEKLSAESLQAIGFCLVASDHFEWGGDTDEGARVADTVLDWASPEINYDLNTNNIAKSVKAYSKAETRSRMRTRYNQRQDRISGL